VGGGGEEGKDGGGKETGVWGGEREVGGAEWKGGGRRDMWAE